MDFTFFARLQMSSLAQAIVMENFSSKYIGSHKFMTELLYGCFYWLPERAELKITSFNVYVYKSSWDTIQPIWHQKIRKFSSFSLNFFQHFMVLLMVSFLYASTKKRREKEPSAKILIMIKLTILWPCKAKVPILTVIVLKTRMKHFMWRHFCVLPQSIHAENDTPSWDVDECDWRSVAKSDFWKSVFPYALKNPSFFLG